MKILTAFSVFLMSFSAFAYTQGEVEIKVDCRGLPVEQCMAICRSNISDANDNKQCICSQRDYDPEFPDADYKLYCSFWVPGPIGTDSTSTSDRGFGW